MQTFKRIGTSIAQGVFQQQGGSVPPPKYASLDQDDATPAAAGVVMRRHHSRWQVFSWTLNAILLVAVLGLSWERYKKGSMRDGRSRCELDSDRLFGQIPWKLQVIDNEERFVDAKPPPYMVGEVGINKTDSVNPWDEIYPSVWVAFSEPSLGGMQGHGMKMKHVAADPNEWEENSEGFGVAVMHQVHCVAVVKYALLTYEETGEAGTDQVHLHHCVETLRQAVMCHADMTLEHPGMDNPYDIILSGWENTHLCRDWDSVITAIRKHAIKHKPVGWARFEEGELKG